MFMATSLLIDFLDILRCFRMSSSPRVNGFVYGADCFVGTTVRITQSELAGQVSKPPGHHARLAIRAGLTCAPVILFDEVIDSVESDQTYGD